MLDILLNSINDGTINAANPDRDGTPRIHGERELYQLLLVNDFMMKMQNIEAKVYNCPLSWWNSSAHSFKTFERLVVKYLAIPATFAPSEHIWSQAARALTVKQNRMLEKVTSVVMYCKENR
jgi:hypothetical protein